MARRALAGQQGNGSGSISGPVTLVADEEPETAAEGPSGQPSAAPLAVPAAVRLPLEGLITHIVGHSWKAPQLQDRI